MLPWLLWIALIARGGAPSLDSDFDGLPDDQEAFGDTDGDGVDDVFDNDDDGDGLMTIMEIAVPQQDPDGDGVPNHLDLDSDGDLWPDAEEGDGDLDGDGILNWVDGSELCELPTDADGDGVDDPTEHGLDTDGDGIGDTLDVDDDGDGLPTADELGPECDDGGPVAVLCARTSASTFEVQATCSDGTVLASRAYRDSDGDGLADFRDPDDDGDGLSTAAELGRDLDCDGVDDALDTEDDDLCPSHDTGSPALPDSPTADGERPPQATGCGCGTSPGEAAGGWVLLALLAARIRARTGA